MGVLWFILSVIGLIAFVIVFGFLCMLLAVMIANAYMNNMYEGDNYENGD